VALKHFMAYTAAVVSSDEFVSPWIVIGDACGTIVRYAVTLAPHFRKFVLDEDILKIRTFFF
jgi:hypothetical protein